MNIVRAKSNRNKLGIFDNRPFAIDLELMKNGFKVFFVDLVNGEKRQARYMDREAFNEEWELCYNVDNREAINYGIINGYME